MQYDMVFAARPKRLEVPIIRFMTKSISETISCQDASVSAYKRLRALTQPGTP